ncbi:MAG: hypothetical protein KAH20_06285 [Methylococcales bacterium]|nr:hypothetical protein [Methylococcales bacterium]
MNDELKNTGKHNSSPLFKDIQLTVEQGKQQVAQAFNVGLTATYWNIEVYVLYAKK